MAAPKISSFREATVDVRPCEVNTSSVSQLKGSVMLTSSNAEKSSVVGVSFLSRMHEIFLFSKIHYPFSSRAVDMPFRRLPSPSYMMTEIRISSSTSSMPS